MKKGAMTTTAVYQELRNTLHSFLEAQYHIWDESLIRERRGLLEFPGITVNEPYYEATPIYKSITNGYLSLSSLPETVRKTLHACSKLEHSPVFPHPFTHQAQAMEQFVGHRKELIIATGTGSGKTESFLLPLIASLVQESTDRPINARVEAVRALLLYPMNALVNDQVTRLRKLVGDPRISRLISEGRGRPVRFGMYTSRTPYPGIRRSARQDADKLRKRFRDFFGVSDATRAKLADVGMWPAKDMQTFSENGFRTSPSDIELLTRHEMQEAPPDILVTNYSMLEYMLIRPIERDIFDKTKAWLSADPKSFFTVILDEAHMYRGAAGAEVALLLRRLQSRLGIDRTRIRYILTSASLGEGDDAEATIRSFAADLTGLGPTDPQFVTVTGEQEFPPEDGKADPQISGALAKFDRTLLEPGYLDDNVDSLREALDQLCITMHAKPVASGTDLPDIQDGLFSSLWELPVVGRLVRVITSKPQEFSDLLKETGIESAEGLEALISLCNFARRGSDGRVLLPVRMHLFFRGLGGLYACVNLHCSYRRDSGRDTGSPSPLLGRCFDEPRWSCMCGSRVYEVLTHRDCGAAYLRAYAKGPSGDFLWHEASSDASLLETHLLIQPPATGHQDLIECWLHTPTGRLKGSPPDGNDGQFIRVFRPARVITIDHRRVCSFDRACPVCSQGWRAGTTKIMDLTTKGDAPFAHLIKTQVQTQPAMCKETPLFPNGGRKSLLFSDGRQKAARLARDVPRVVEQDVFRQLLIGAVQEIKKAGYGECKANTHLYLGWIHALSLYNLRMFDGDDRRHVTEIVNKYIRDYDKDIRSAIDDDFSPRQVARYQTELLRQLGNRFYSITALTLGYCMPAKAWLQRLSARLSSMSESDVCSASCLWLQHALAELAFDPSIPARARSIADGRPRPAQEWGLETQLGKTGKLDRRLRGLETHLGRQGALEFDTAMLELLCEQKEGRQFVTPSRIVVRDALSDAWFRCERCTWLSPFGFRNRCAECGNDNLVQLNPEKSDYLRARKRFWRDPVERIVTGKDRPFSIDVEEHTAQLGYLDSDDTASTTEEYERRFKDILTEDDDEPIDVLSSTTTMEVGIDIGSLIAIGLRNVPPMRQNYQQRAGRAGRRGSAVSSVLTYAQNGAHDAYYFKAPTEIIRGQPPLPSIDIANPRIVERHIHAALMQSFFHEQISEVAQSGNLFSALGRATDFFNGDGRFSLPALGQWLAGPAGQSFLTLSQRWIPAASHLNVSEVSKDFVDRLARISFAADDEQLLLDYLFEQGLFPTYAFPRTLCALQIERRQQGRVVTEQRPQQALSTALSEYSPGRLVVVNKKTYKVGAVAADIAGVDRAAPLFLDSRAISYIHCQNCGYTQLPGQQSTQNADCPFCHIGQLAAVEVIRPEVVYPEGAHEVDEFGDDPVFSYATSAQYPVPAGHDTFQWQPVGKQAMYVSASNQMLIMVNKGIEIDGGYSGFNICQLCGRAPPPGEQLDVPHSRNYLLPAFLGASSRCTGQSRNVYLGFNFRSDLFVLRIALHPPLIQSLNDDVVRRPMDAALRSLSESISLASTHLLDVDPRDLGCGFRFIATDTGYVADLFLYDTASGGAGYAHRAGERLSEVLEAARQLMADCDCDSSCRKCLRHYGNRLIHYQLNRHLALQMLQYAQLGTTPSLDPVDQQIRNLTKLRQMLELAGYQCGSSEQVPLILDGSKSIGIGCYPSLLEKKLCGHPLYGTGFIFSDDQLVSDLPGVYSQLVDAL